MHSAPPFLVPTLQGCLTPFEDQLKMPRCTATTQNGTQCRRQAEGPRCYQHTAAARVAPALDQAPVPAPEDQLIVAEMRRRHQAAQTAAIIREAEAQIRRAEFIIEQQRALIARNRPTLADFVRDGQNVHTPVAREGLHPIYEALAAYHLRAGGRPLMPWMTMAYDLSDRIYALPGQKKGLKFWLSFCCYAGHLLHPAMREFAHTINSTDTPVLRSARGRNLSLYEVMSIVFTAATALNNEDLWTRIAQEVLDGRGTCVQGKGMRLLNAFSGFEHLIGMSAPADPRSRNERLGDLFSALRMRELSAVEVQAEATRILDAEGVTEATERAVWLEAL